MSNPWTTTLRIVDFFLPSSLTARAEVQSKGRLLIGLSWAFIFLWLLPAFGQGFLEVGFGVIAGGLLILIPFLLRISGSLSLCGNILILLVTVLNFYRYYLDAGSTVSILWWQALPPVIGLIILGTGLGLFWLMICLIGVAAFHFAASTQLITLATARGISTSGDDWIVLTNIGGLALMLILVTWFLEHSKNRVLGERTEGIAHATALLNRLQRAQQQIQAHALCLRSSAEALAATSGRMKRGATKMSSLVTEAAVAINEGAETIRVLAGTLATSSEQMAVLQRISSVAEAKGTDGGRIVAESSQAIKKIEISSQEIETIVEVITEIADTAHLVSLNAAIETAKAGDRGKGFMLVVDEIRKLAKRSNDAVVEIRKQIRQSAFVLRSGREVIADTLETFKRIHQYLKKMAHRIHETTHAIREQDIGLQEIAKGSKETAVVAKDNAALLHELSQSIDDSYQAIEELNRVSQALEDQVLRLKNSSS